MIVLDSTGLKVTNRGEWLREKHGKKARKGWVKLHLAFELNSRKVVELDVTDERVHNSQKSVELVERSRKMAEGEGRSISKVIVDAGYDTHEFFKYLGAHGIEPVVMVRSSAKTRGNTVRDKVVSAIREDKRRWKSAMGYGKRWFGEYVSSAKFENIKKEAMYKVDIINMLLMVGMV